jgi:hypothetical protein
LGEDETSKGLEAVAEHKVEHYNQSESSVSAPQGKTPFEAHRVQVRTLARLIGKNLALLFDGKISI